PGPGAHTLRPEGAASLFQNGDASSLRAATVTGPATRTDELGAGRPGAVREKASSLPGGESRAAEPGSDSLGCGEAPLQSAQKDEIHCTCRRERERTYPRAFHLVAFCMKLAFWGREFL
uniref:Uncharacterized protein n=1 Tax=Mustela putorius furo TaxID=9669 RepID=M3Y1X1_MUSPF